MSTTYLFPSTLKGLADVSVSPGAEQSGYPLTWNNTTGKWEARNISQGNINLVNGGITFLDGLGLPNTNQSALAVNFSSTPPTSFFVKGAFVPFYGQFTVEANPGDNRSGFGLFGAGGSPRYVFFLGGANSSAMFSQSEEFIIVSQRPAPFEQTYSSFKFLPFGILSIDRFVSSTSTTTGNVVVPGGIGVGENATIGGYLRIANSSTPASASASGLVGQISWDSNYFYICTASNTWKRVALSTW